MPSTSEIISSQQNEINQRLNDYLNEFLELFKNENERLFINCILFNHFFYKNSFDSEYTFEFNSDFYSFSNLEPIYVSNIDKEFEKTNRKVIFEDCYKYKLIGFKFIETRDEFHFLPNYSIELSGNKYQIDIALLFIQVVNGKKNIINKIAIECEALELDKTNEKFINEVQKSRLMLLDKWKTYRLSDCDIRNNANIEGISKIIYDLRELCNEHNPFYKIII